MKKIVIVVFLLLASAFVFADGLNGYAESIKEAAPETYNAIAARAIIEWGSDHVMIVWEINGQCEAFIEGMDLFDKDRSLFVECVLEWCDDCYAVYDDIMTAPVDWKMVRWEFNRQYAAKVAY